MSPSRLAALGTILLAANAASGETFVVRPDGTGDFPTIQAALAAAPWGSVIELAAGTYTGPGNRDLHFHGKPITIRPQDDQAGACILDCQGSAVDPHRGFIFDWGEGPGSVVQGVTIQNGYATGIDPPDPQSLGGGIILHEGASPTFVDVVIRDCTAEDGGGVAMMSDANPTFLRCTFQGNEAWWGAGGGVWCLWGASPMFTDCTFAGNSTEQGGGGLSSYYPDTLRVTGCLFRDNVVWSGYGAGMTVVGGTVEIEDCTFVGNSFASGGAKAAASSSRTRARPRSPHAPSTPTTRPMAARSRQATGRPWRWRTRSCPVTSAAVRSTAAQAARSPWSVATSGTTPAATGSAAWQDSKARTATSNWILCSAFQQAAT